MNQYEELEYRRDCLQKRRNYFLESIAVAADEIAAIDRQIEILRNEEHKFDGVDPDS